VNEGAGIMMLVLAPAAVGIGCLGMAIALFAKAKGPDGVNRTIYLVFAVIFLIAALGIGSCYGMMLLD
jgi:hypothetical protein